jgi:hypothetical protein
MEPRRKEETPVMMEDSRVQETLQVVIRDVTTTSRRDTTLVPSLLGYTLFFQSPLALLSSMYSRTINLQAKVSQSELKGDEPASAMSAVGASDYNQTEGEFRESSVNCSLMPVNRY